MNLKKLFQMYHIHIGNMVLVPFAKNDSGLKREYTPPIVEIICVKNVGAIVVCGFFMK